MKEKEHSSHYTSEMVGNNRKKFCLTPTVLVHMHQSHRRKEIPWAWLLESIPHFTVAPAGPVDGVSDTSKWDALIGILHIHLQQDCRLAPVTMQEGYLKMCQASLFQSMLLEHTSVTATLPRRVTLFFCISWRPTQKCVWVSCPLIDHTSVLSQIFYHRCSRLLSTMQCRNSWWPFQIETQ